MSIALSPVDPVSLECAKIAESAYQAGVAALKPGLVFDELVDIMEKPITDAGCWYLTPVVHTFNPLMAASGRTQVGIEQLPGITTVKGYQGRGTRGGHVVIQPGMVFSMQPNACRGRYRVNIGGTVMITETGVEELNRLPNKMNIK